MDKITIAILPALLACLMLSSCAATTQKANLLAPDAPTVEKFRPSLQRQLNASAHWSVIANDMASTLKKALKKKKLDKNPVYLHLYSEDTAFTEAFNDFFTTHLVKKGILVSKNKQNSTVFNYKIQPISFKAFRTTTRTSNLKWTTLAAGVLVLHNLFDQWAGDSELISLGVGAELLNDDSAPHLELIISSSILNNGIYLHKTSDIYYANKTDINLYRNQRNANRAAIFDDPFYDNF